MRHSDRMLDMTIASINARQWRLEDVRLRVECEGDAPWECTAAEFCEANPDLADRIVGMAVGELASFGGGAEPLAVVERVE